MVDFKASTSADKFAALSDVETGACAGCGWFWKGDSGFRVLVLGSTGLNLP